MTVTAARPRQAPHSDGRLLSSTFKIRQRPADEPPSPDDGEQVGVIRNLARELLADEELGSVADDAALVVSELLTNAILHSGGHEITLSLTLRNGGSLRIDVRDGVPNHHPAPRTPGDDDEHGRGLLLVEMIAASRQGTWGVSDGGATTWCELDVADPH